MKIFIVRDSFETFRNLEDVVEFLWRRKAVNLPNFTLFAPFEDKLALVHGWFVESDLDSNCFFLPKMIK